MHDNADLKISTSFEIPDLNGGIIKKTHQNHILKELQGNTTSFTKRTIQYKNPYRFASCIWNVLFFIYPNLLHSNTFCQK